MPSGPNSSQAENTFPVGRSTYMHIYTTGYADNDDIYTERSHNHKQH